MATAKGILAQIESLTESEYAKLQTEWGKAGKVKRRWFAFAGGVIAGVAGTLIVSMLFSCSSKDLKEWNSAEGFGAPPPCPPVTATFCVKGPTVVP